MHALIPVLERGLTYWDRSLLPSDEFETRVMEIQAAMRAEGLDGLVIWSQQYHTNGDLTYLAGWPMGGALLVPRDGEPAMFSVGGGREQYFQRMQTWLSDLRSVPSALGEPMAAMLGERGISSGRIGVVGFDLMSVRALANLKEALSAYELVDYAERFQALRAPKRPRELLAIANSLRIAQAAAAAGQAAFYEGASNSESVVEAERIARIEGARDLRLLANLGPRGLRPFERLEKNRQPSLILWVAVDQHAYWAEASNVGAGAAGTAADRAVAAMLGAAVPGASADAVAQAGLALIDPAAHADALSYGLGNGMGLGPQEMPLIAPGNKATLAEGMVLVLRAHVTGPEAPSLVTRMVRITASGAKAITPR